MMKVIPDPRKKIGVTVEDLDARTATESELLALKEVIYRNKIAVLKSQDLSPGEYVTFGRRMGHPEAYYQPMYHHPDEKEIFVSSNVMRGGNNVGVPKTGKFWHADYAFMKAPFAFTMLYPREVPSQNRGTYFINMGDAYRKLPADLKNAISGTRCHHSVRRYFKIRPSDVFRPIGEVVDEIERETPPVIHPTVIKHPVTGEEILFINEGFTFRIEDERGNDLGSDLLRSLLEETGQLDTSYRHDNIHLQTFEVGDLLVWDNRSLVHCGLHTGGNEPSTTFRVTLHDNQKPYELVLQEGLAG
jgi:alpha-ketoglutarate-dependent taurine dioxygenase